jgi:raffinose/stachyose/melibiose transport system substrate-binding protein
MVIRRTGKFKAATAVLSILTSITLVAGCSSNNGGAADPQPSQSPQSSGTGATAGGQKKLSGSIEVGILHAEGTSGYNFTTSNVGDKIMKDNPGTKINYAFVNTKARPVIEQRWRAGSPPDLDYFVFNGQVPKTFEFVDKLMDLTPYLNEKLPGTDTKWIDTFTPSSLSLMQHDNKYYGVITDTHVIALYYNKKIFDNLKLTPPKTWDDFMDVSQKLKDNKIDPIAVTGQYTPYMGMWTDYLFQRTVGYDETSKAVRGEGFKNNPGFLDAAKKVQEMRDKGFLMKGFQGTDFTAAQIQFFQGKTGMLLMGSWLTSEMKDAIPADFQVGVTAFPTVTGGKGEQNGVLAHANIMSMNKATKNPDLALEFMQQFTNKDLQAKRLQEMSSLSAIKGVTVSKDLFGLQDVLDNTGKYNVRYYGMEFEPDLNTAYYLEVSKLFFGDYTAEKFIDAIDAVAKKFKK